ncbi:MAG: hypothetical protein JSS91_05660 [Bacteroidetes bacterium]|nr:hypothetical protein [Bacteroidota bacterium]
MYTNSLFDLLQSFSEKEMMKFNKFLNSPYFSNSRNLIALFNVLRKYYPGFDQKNFTKENIYKKVFGHSRYNDSTLRNLNSDLLKCAMMFLKTERMLKEDVQSNFLLTHEMFEKGNYDLLRKQMKKTETELVAKNTLDGDYFYYRYKINTDLFYLNLLTQKVIKKNYVISESKKMIDGIIYILIFFIIESVKHNDNLLKYTRSYNIKRYMEFIKEFTEIFNFDKMMDFVNRNSDIKINIIEIYYNLLKTYINFDDENYYFEFKNSLTHYSQMLGKNDNNFLFSRLMDYCVMKINAGQQTSFDIQMEIFDLNKTYIEKEYYKTGSSKYIPFDLYRNVIMNCIKVKKLDYMESFIRKYSKQLHPSQKSSVESYSKSLYYFEKHEFENALSNLNEIKFDQFVYKLDMKNLQLKIQYELGEYEGTIYVIDTYKHFLKNNKLLSDSRRLFHNNFLTYVQKLILFKTGSGNVNLNYLYDMVNASNDIFDKEWLLQKIGELLKRSGKSLKKSAV